MVLEDSSLLGFIKAYLNSIAYIRTFDNTLFTFAFAVDRFSFILGKKRGLNSLVQL